MRKGKKDRGLWERKSKCESLRERVGREQKQRKTKSSAEFSPTPSLPSNLLLHGDLTVDMVSPETLSWKHGGKREGASERQKYKDRLKDNIAQVATRGCFQETFMHLDRVTVAFKRLLLNVFVPRFQKISWLCYQKSRVIKWWVRLSYYVWNITSSFVFVLFCFWISLEHM